MGHYDSQREAHEDSIRMRRGFEFRQLIADRSDLELADFLSRIGDLREMSRQLIGTCEQHQKMEQIRSSMDKFFERRPKE